MLNGMNGLFEPLRESRPLEAKEPSAQFLNYPGNTLRGAQWAPALFCFPSKAPLAFTRTGQNSLGEPIPGEKSHLSIETPVPMGTVRVAAGQRVDSKEVGPMKILENRNGSRFSKTMVTGLAPVLLLITLPGCVARHMPDWSTVQAVAPGTETEVRLNEDEVVLDSDTKGRFLSATGEAVTLKFKDGQIDTFQRKDIRKVLTRRSLAKRWPGWITLGVSALLVAQLGNLDGPESNRVYIQLFTTLPLATAVFWGSKMGGIYEAPRARRDWFPQEANSPTEEAKNSK